MNPRRFPLILGAILLACTAGVYLPARHFQFVDWDDFDEVTQNPLLHPATRAHLWQFWTQPYLRLYGPLTYSFWWGMSQDSLTLDVPQAFHLLSITLHLICAGLVFAILLKCVKSPVAAFGGATLFALHPFQVESIAWIAETNNLLAAALSLGAILAFLSADESRRGWWMRYSLASMLYLLALFAKPTAVVTPIIVAILAIGLMRKSWRWVGLALGPWILAAGVFSWIAHQVQLVRITRVWDRPVVAVDAIAFYLQKLVWPVGLGIDYARTPSSVAANKDWILGAAVVIALAIVLWLARKTERGLAVGGLVMLAGLFPVLGFVSFTFQEFSTVADRFMYLAMLGPALALAAVLARIKLSKALAIVAAMGLVLTWLTAAQLKIWRNTDELVKHTLAMDPGSTIGHSIAGAELYRIGMPAGAARHFTAAIARDPSDPDFHYNLANALRDSQQYDQAVAEYQRAIGLWNSPNLNALNNMGATYAKMGRPDLAKVMFDHVLEIDPKNPQATENLRIISLGVPMK